MKLADISKENKNLVLEQLGKHVQDINTDEVEVVVVENTKIKVSYRDFILELPVKCPDQATSNILLAVLVGGVLVLAGVGVWGYIKNS